MRRWCWTLRLDQLGLGLGLDHAQHVQGQQHANRYVDHAVDTAVLLTHSIFLPPALSV